MSTNKEYDECLNLAKQGKLPKYTFDIGDEPCLTCRHYKSKRLCGYEDGQDCVLDEGDLLKYAAKIALEKLENAETIYPISDLLCMYDELWLSTAGFEETEYYEVYDSSIEGFLEWIEYLGRIRIALTEVVCQELGWGLGKLESILEYFKCNIFLFSEAIDKDFLIGGEEFNYSDSLCFLDKCKSNRWDFEKSKKEWGRLLSNNED